MKCVCVIVSNPRYWAVAATCAIERGVLHSTAARRSL
eukprot:CAMPEP_0181253758 /NCGR_PEP_ID=MMETSP1096-20121128/48209_1 /TAXON_ID=156174 ORGANISM="Chrysochromulina ericina, Strain CCMP281" /NCGR_SAMPLE_ID=MMETSP1096 /ASSEMBLY_ACC=CAM_ASM_000453 /LENGTH=36 /DNA_ID= /DNA_START= /DNA_END= /DNA_ORIENTATION=